MTPQEEILTTMKAGQRANGEVIVNRFYGRSVEEIHENKESAEEVYQDVWRRFLFAWYKRGSEGVPPCEWGRLN